MSLSAAISPLNTCARNVGFDLFLRLENRVRILVLYAALVSGPSDLKAACSTAAAQVRIAEGSAVER